MSRPVYSLPILAVQGFGSSSLDVTVPTGQIYVVRDISGELALGDTSGDVNVTVDSVVIWSTRARRFGLGPFHWEGRVTCSAGSPIAANWNTGLGFVSIYVSGYSLSV